MASCWVIVEPPCVEAARVRLLKTARVSPIGSTPIVRIEAAVLDRDDGLRDVGRHLVQADRLAAGHAAIGDQLAVDRDDLDVRRPVGNRPVGDARHARAVVDDDAGGGDAAPDHEHEAPVEQSARAAEQPPRDRAPRSCQSAPLRGLLPATGRLTVGRHDAILLADGKARQLPAPAPDRRRSARCVSLSAIRHSVPCPPPMVRTRLETKCGDLRGR